MGSICDGNLHQPGGGFGVDIITQISIVDNSEILFSPFLSNVFRSLDSFPFSSLLGARRLDLAFDPYRRARQLDSLSLPVLISTPMVLINNLNFNMVLLSVSSRARLVKVT